MSIRLIIFLAASLLLTCESCFHWLVPIPALSASGDDSITGKIVVLADGLERPLCQRGINHRDLPLSDFSPYLKQALIASEDSRFDWHLGLDPIGLVSAIATLGKRGGSTISQQVARTASGIRTGGDKSIPAKLKEIVYAVQLELFYNKDEILRTYLNRVYLGHSVTSNIGFEAASQSYFGKSAIFLDPAEAASLVSILPAPNNYKYFGDNIIVKNKEGREISKSENVKNRRDSIVGKMSNLGFIDANTKSKAQQSAINVFNNKVDSKDVPNSKAVSTDFCDYIVNDELPAHFGNKISANQSLIIETTIDINAQQKAERALDLSIDLNGEQIGYSQGAILSLKLNSGEIVSMVGGKGGINRVTQSYLQPGSTFKIFNYIAALEKRISLDRKFSCEAFKWGITYKPCERSPNAAEISLRDGLILSENVISLRLAEKVGLEKVIETADNLGVKFKGKILPKDRVKLEEKIKQINKVYEEKQRKILESKIEGDQLKQETDKLASQRKNEIDKAETLSRTPYTKLDEKNISPGLVLGEKEVRLFDLTPVYATIGNRGIRNKPHGIRRIRDARNCVNPLNIDTCYILYDNNNKIQNPNSSQEKIAPTIAAQLDDTLHQAVNRGTGKRAYFEGSQAAGKTGTTDNGKDMWFIGYSRNKCLATGIWLGNDNDKGDKTKKEERNSGLSAELWKNYMQKLPNKDNCK
jgi:membrane peptidoglycan carboxypeptidase